MDVEPQKPLIIFKTDADKYGRDIMVMSDFFDGHVQQMSLSLKKQSNLKIASEIPVANIGIISDVVHQANIVMQGNITLLPDLDSLLADIRAKLKKEYILFAIQSKLMVT